MIFVAYQPMISLQEHLCTTFKLAPSEADSFLAGFTKTVLKKNEVFTRDGEVCHTIGLVEKGLLKCVYNREGEEVVFEFAFENQFIADYYSFVTRTPSAKEIRCIEDTVLYVINREQLETMAKTHAFMGRMSRKMNERLFLKMHERLSSFLLDTPTQRYQQLIAERADLVNRIPQYLVASYLNVQPETISRIRRKLANS